MSEFLHFSEHQLQEGALLFMALVYTLRLRWLLRFKAGKERQASTGLGDTNPRKGFIYSWANVAMPGAMESTRTKPFLYGQFVVFHMGVVAAIGLSFVIPYGAHLLTIRWLAIALQVIIGGACLVGVMRMWRRAGNKHMRAISTPDDYFSLLLLTVWFGFAFFAVPNSTAMGEWHLLTYFLLTAFFLIYVPFSKISHYLYYPFTRYYLGKTMGHRGVFPLRRRPDVAASEGSKP
ncbi:MAG: respiratory nitrate reductase subunit gamma [bacterium]|nr:respiratory nitrate reductase subunit gamma [bacterium]